MKRTIICVVIVLSAAISAFAQSAPDAPELTRLLNEFLAGAGRNDAAAHDRFWAEDLIYTRSAGVRTNKDELMKGVRSAPVAKPDDPVTVYTAEDIRIQQYGNAAVVAFKLVGNATKADGTKAVTNNLNTGTFIKRKGTWQVVAWQSTIIPKPENVTMAVPQPMPAAPKALVLTPTAQPPLAGRTYLKGPRGGCYYLNSGGTKIYVDHKYCN